MIDHSGFPDVVVALEQQLVAELMKGDSEPLRRALTILADLRTRPDRDEASLRALDELGLDLARELSSFTASGIAGAVAKVRAHVLDRAAQAMAHTPAEEPLRPFRASIGVAQLHGGVDLPAPQRSAAHRRFGALSAPSRSVVRPTDRKGHELARWARGELDEIAAMGTLRTIRADDAWTAGRGMEERLLTSLDGLISLARRDLEPPIDLASTCTSFVDTSPVADKGRTFARAFVIACIEGPRALTHLHVIARESAHEVHPALLDALCLGSSPDVPQLANTLIDEDEAPELLALALGIFVRKQLDGGSAALALVEHPRPDVAALAVRAARHAPPDDAGPMLSRALESTSRGVALEAAILLAAKGSSLGSSRLPALAAESAAPHQRDALVAWALTARRADVDAVIEVASHAGAAGLEALGWLGHVDGFEVLLAALEGPDQHQREHAAWALARITGRGLDRWASDGIGPSSDPAPWKAWVAELRAVPGQRLRFGRAWTPAEPLAELTAPRTLQKERRTLLLELSIARRGFWLDLDDWVARQLALLRATNGPRAHGVSAVGRPT